MKYVLVQSEQILKQIEEKHVVIKEDFQRIRPILQNNIRAIDKARVVINESFESLQTSIQNLVHATGRYHEKREEIAKMKNCILGAHRNSQQIQCLQGAVNENSYERCVVE